MLKQITSYRSGSWLLNNSGYLLIDVWNLLHGAFEVRDPGKSKRSFTGCARLSHAHVIDVTFESQLKSERCIYIYFFFVFVFFFLQKIKKEGERALSWAIGTFSFLFFLCVRVYPTFLGSGWLVAHFERIHGVWPRKIDHCTCLGISVFEEIRFHDVVHVATSIIYLNKWLPRCCPFELNDITWSGRIIVLNNIS